ncbi:MAG: DUF3226 domain-containing protein [Thermodesulfobacteriota bacterium]
MVRPPVQIKEKKLLLVEGTDALYFAVWAYQAFGATGMQVLNFGGNTELGLYLRSLTQLSGYEGIEAIAIARDAENDPKGAIDSIRKALKASGLSVPKVPFQFEGSSPKIAFMVFPGFSVDPDGNEYVAPGTLEDLCLETLEDTKVLSCVDQYISCLETAGEPVRCLHKSRLHAYLAGKSNFVGLKIGEAAKAGAWNWQHPGLEPFKRIILGM